jgi:hypothetical protein
MPASMVLIYTAAGQAEAALLISLLEANGIQVISLQEGAGQAYGLTVGILGEVELWVPARQQADAKALLRDYLEGSPDGPVEDSS